MGNKLTPKVILEGTRLILVRVENTPLVSDTVRAYALQVDELISLAKSRLTRSLTTEECQQYLHVEKCP